MPSIENRNHGSAFLARRILGEVWNHPNNRGRRLRAVARSAAWQIDKRRPGRPQRTRKVFGNMRIWMNPAFGSISNIVYFGDRFDPEEMGFLERYLRPGDKVVDAGANVGAYTLLASGLVGPSGHVDAVEPVPSLADELGRNVALNSLEERVTIHRLALSDRSGTIGFRGDRDVSSRLAVPDDPEATVTETPCARLDDVVGDDELALLKIDVEGAETAALRGFLSHLGNSNPPVVLLEVLGPQLERQGSSVDQLVELLTGAGYEFTRLAVGSTGLRPVVPAMDSGNVVAVARDRAAEVELRLANRD